MVKDALQHMPLWSGVTIAMTLGTVIGTLVF